MNLQQTTNMLKQTLSQIDELRENLEILYDHSRISEFTYEKHYEELCEMESTMERKIRQQEKNK